MKIIMLVIGLAFSFSALADESTVSTQQSFWQNLSKLCGATYQGDAVFPNEVTDAFYGKKLIAHFASCTANEIRVPFIVGEDKSRTWVITNTPNGLQLKHDHRHADGTPDEVTMYGGMASVDGSALSQFFKADGLTIKLIPAAATNVWQLSFSPDFNQLTYYLERNAKPRFKAVLNKTES